MNGPVFQFIIGVLIFSSVPVFAVNVVRPRSLPQASQCSTCNAYRQPECAHREMIVKAAYMGSDDRESISKNKEKVGFTNAEVERIMACTGYIFCPQAFGGDGGMQSAGAVCSPGQRRAGKCAADRLASMGHLFLEEPQPGQRTEEISFVPEIGDCMFYGYKGHESRLVTGDVTPIFSPSDPYLNPIINDRNEGLAVRLETPIPNCDPLDLVDSSYRLTAGTGLTVVTYPHVDQSEEAFPGTEPLAYDCKITRMVDKWDGKPQRFLSDCDLNGIGSGAFGLVRRNGRLEVAAMFMKAADPEHNGKPYNEKAGIFTTGLGVSDYFRKLVEIPGQVPEPWTAPLVPPINSRPASN